VIEDDSAFARLLLEIAHETGFKAVVALRGDTGLSLAHAVRPDAIILDMGLPVMDGWTVLARLKTHPATRDIPVHVLSGKSDGEGALSAGAVTLLEKPASFEELTARFEEIAATAARTGARVLVVERPGDGQGAMQELVASLGEVELTAASTPREALA